MRKLRWEAVWKACSTLVECPAFSVRGSTLAYSERAVEDSSEPRRGVGGPGWGEALRSSTQTSLSASRWDEACMVIKGYFQAEDLIVNLVLYSQISKR
jgi:hypothetical protein